LKIWQQALLAVRVCKIFSVILTDLCFAGALKDQTGSFTSAFLFGGTTLLAACLLSTIVHLVRCRRQFTSI